MEERKPVAYCYIRFSTKEQGLEGKDSQRRQIDGIRRLAAEYNLEILDENIYEDKGVSAYSGKLMEKGSKLYEIIDQIKNLQIKEGDYLICESIDRLSRRRLSEIKNLVNGILESGINIITTLDKKRYTKKSVDDLADQMFISLIAARANEESKIKSERVALANANKRRLAEQGKVIARQGNLPYGITYIEETKSYGIDLVKQEEIKELFKILRSVGVVESINRLKTKFPNSTITPAQARFMIESKYVIGYYHAKTRQNRKKVHYAHIPDVYPKLIKVSDFNAVIDAIEKRRTSPDLTGRRTKYDLNIFKGITKCSCCNSTMIFESGVSKYNNLDIFYYNCKSRKEDKNSCVSERPRFDYVFALFLNMIFKTKSDMLAYRREGKGFKVNYYDKERTKKLRIAKRIKKTSYRLIKEGDYFELGISYKRFDEAQLIFSYYKEGAEINSEIQKNYIYKLNDENIFAMNYFNNIPYRMTNLGIFNNEKLENEYEEFRVNYLSSILKAELDQRLDLTEKQRATYISQRIDSIESDFGSTPYKHKSLYSKFLNKVFTDIQKGFKNSLLSLFNTSGIADISDEIEEIITELEKIKSSIKITEEKINKFIELGMEFDDILIHNLKKYKESKKDKEAKIEELTRKNQSMKKVVDINDSKEFLTLFSTVEGRTRINEYLQDKGVKIKIRFYKEIRALEMEVLLRVNKEEQRIAYQIRKFPLKFPLREFLGKEIGTVRDLIK